MAAANALAATGATDATRFFDAPTAKRMAELGHRRRRLGEVLVEDHAQEGVGVGVAGGHLHGSCDGGVAAGENGSVFRGDASKADQPALVGKGVRLVRVDPQHLVVELDGPGDLAFAPEDRRLVQGLLLLLGRRERHRAGRRLTGKPDPGKGSGQQRRRHYETQRRGNHEHPPHSPVAEPAPKPRCLRAGPHTERPAGIGRSRTGVGDGAGRGAGGGASRGSGAGRIVGVIRDRRFYLGEPLAVTIAEKLEVPFVNVTPSSLVIEVVHRTAEELALV